LKYVNAKEVLPPELLEIVQEYTCGVLIYIPKAETNKKAWGELSGAKESVLHRNKTIYDSYKSGTPISSLMTEYFLSEASIKKIIYNKELYEDQISA